MSPNCYTPLYLLRKLWIKISRQTDQKRDRINATQYFKDLANFSENKAINVAVMKVTYFIYTRKIEN